MIAVAVVSHNTRQLLMECIASVVESTRDMDARIVLVDNASQDGSVDAVTRTWPHVLVIANDVNLGFGRACNQAIEATTCPFILLLNGDTRVSPDAIQAMQNCMNRLSRCGAAGCEIVDVKGNRVVNTRNFLNPFNQSLELLGLGRTGFPGRLRRTYIPRTDASGCECRVDWIDGACLMLRREALDTIGLFDERFFMYSEDEDLCFRLKKAGWSICFSANGSVVHHGGASSARYRSEMLRQFYLSQMLFLAKHQGQRALRQYAAAMKLVLRAKILARTRAAPEAIERLEALNATIAQLREGTANTG